MRGKLEKIHRSRDTGDSQQSSDQDAQKKPLDVVRRQAVENQGVKSKKSALVGGGGGDIGSGESEKFEDKNMQNPDNAKNANSQQKVYKRQYSTSKKSRKKKNQKQSSKNRGKGGKKNGLEQTISLESEEKKGLIQLSGGKEKLREIRKTYEIIDNSSNTRFKRIKRLITMEYKIKEIKLPMRNMTESKKDIWQSVLSRKKEQPIQGAVFKLDLSDLDRYNWGY